MTNRTTQPDTEAAVRELTELKREWPVPRPVEDFIMRLLSASPASGGVDADMRAFGASEIAAYKWPDDTPEHRAARAAFCEGAASLSPAPTSGSDRADGPETEAVLRRDGPFLTVEWWRFGKRLTARVYEPQGMVLSPALADLLALALEDKPHVGAAPVPTSGSEAGGEPVGLVAKLRVGALHRDVPAWISRVMLEASEALATPAPSPAGGVREALEALKPFADIANEYVDQEDDDFQVWKDFDVIGATLPLRIFRNARAIYRQLAALSPATAARGGEDER